MDSNFQFLVARLRPDEGRLTEPTADVQPERRKPLFMPLSGHPDAPRHAMPSGGVYAGSETTRQIADQNLTRMPPNTATGAASVTNRGSEGFATPGSGVLVTSPKIPKVA